MKCWTILAVLVATTLPSMAFATDPGQDPKPDPGRIRSPEYQEARMRRQWDRLSRQLKLREVDQEALANAESFEKAQDTATPTQGSFGAHVFTFGAQVPKILCRPLVYCDIQFQPGEKVVKVFAGDKARWDLNLSQSGGEGTSPVQHLMLKPLQTRGIIETNLIVHTNRRTYQMDLASPSKTPMRYVRFRYPEDEAREFQQALQQSGLEARGQAGEEPPGEYRIDAEPWELHRAYAVEKEGRWRVRRRIDWAPADGDIFDDGHKTFIKMPRRVLSRELPLLLVVTSTGKTAVVEYRVKGQMFIVDRVFEEAVLVSDVGKHQERIRLRRLEKR